MTICLCITEPSGGASGQASDIAIHAKEILRMRKQLTGIYQKHCTKNGENAEEAINRFGLYSLSCAHRRLSAYIFLQRRPLNEITL